ncbi:MAG TPA: hypothetical protein VFS05_11315, partial [Gemmatimonadaceae bacterium]|nr:hypothetical protein [Gemmatimonadaceae bacterium]
QRLTGAGVRYVVIGNVKLSETRLIHFLLADCRRFALAASFPPSSLLLAVRPDGPASAEREACSALARHRDYLGGRGQPDEDTPADGSGGGVAGAALDAPPPM